MHASTPSPNQTLEDNGAGAPLIAKAFGGVSAFMNARDIKQIVQQELACSEPFDGFHGLTRQKLREFLVEPFSVRIDPDDTTSPPREMWVVLQEGRTPAHSYVVVYDPETQSWGFAEQVSGRDFTLLCRADSLATALGSM